MIALLDISWKQWVAERHLRKHGLDLRATSSTDVAAAYDALTSEQFDAINGRQQWANERTLPSLLMGQVPRRPLRVVDLGCGTGGSTQVLAECCPRNSVILAFEQARGLVDAARARFRGPSEVAVTVCRQSISDPLRGPDGKLLPERSIDLVNSSGVLGHHFDVERFGPVLHELGRLIKEGGLASLDSGPTLPAQDMVALMAEAGFRRITEARSCLVDTNLQLLFRREAA